MTVGGKSVTTGRPGEAATLDIVHGAKGFSYYEWGVHGDDPGAER